MSLIKFPSTTRKKIVETKLMKQTISRTLAVHPLGALVIWYGASRIGKTTTAQYMVAKILEAHDANDPFAFRAAYCEVGEIPPWSGNEMKKGIKSLYFAAFRSNLDERVYRRDPPEAVAALLVHELQKRNLQMIFLDEAGGLSVDAIQGMILVRDTAFSMHWPLTLVLIGMDDLPVKVNSKSQIKGRISEWCYFVEYGFDDTWNLLTELHPHFAGLDKNNEEHREQVEFLRTTYGGFPGLLISFIVRMEYRLQDHKTLVDLRFLRAVHLLTARDMQRSIEHSLTHFKGMALNKASKRAATIARIDPEEGSNKDGHQKLQKNANKRKSA
jgi:hypothetical protein